MSSLRLPHSLAVSEDKLLLVQGVTAGHRSSLCLAFVVSLVLQNKSRHGPEGSLALCFAMQPHLPNQSYQFLSNSDIGLSVMGGF